MSSLHSSSSLPTRLPGTILWKVAVTDPATDAGVWLLVEARSSANVSTLLTGLLHAEGFFAADVPVNTAAIPSERFDPPASGLLHADDNSRIWVLSRRTGRAQA